MVNIALVFGALAIYAIIMIWLLIGGLVPQTMMSWVAFFALGIPLWLSLELIGHRISSSKRIDRLSSPIRMVILLVCVLIAGAAALALRSAIQSMNH
jgi:hypothetical protein